MWTAAENLPRSVLIVGFFIFVVRPVEEITADGQQDHKDKHNNHRQVIGLIQCVSTEDRQKNCRKPSDGTDKDPVR